MSDTEGQTALVHLHVPAALKAQWVRQSRAAGLKLTDWIINQVERTVKVFKVPDTLASKYHGSGYALAATVLGPECIVERDQPRLTPPGRFENPPNEVGRIVKLSDAARQRVLVDIVYLEDVFPDFDGTHDAMLAAMFDDCLGPTVRKLQALGQVHAGMLSAWEFVEL